VRESARKRERQALTEEESEENVEVDKGGDECGGQHQGLSEATRC
jgi:hypothetical protein